MHFTAEALDEILRKGNVKIAEPKLVQSCPLMSQHDPVMSHGGRRAGAGRKPKPKSPKPRSEIEELMAEQLKVYGLPEPVRQLKYLEDRKFRADFAWPDRMIALEVDGAVHRIKGTFQRSFEREYLLKMAGWQVLHVGGNEVRKGIAIEWIRNLLTL